jgi:hypothetical protein
MRIPYNVYFCHLSTGGLFVPKASSGIRFLDRFFYRFRNLFSTLASVPDEDDGIDIIYEPAGG